MMRWSVRILLGVAIGVVALLLARVITTRRWEKRVAGFCYAAPGLAARMPVVLSNTDWKMRQWNSRLLLGDLQAYPEPDAIVIRERAVLLLWEPPLLAWTPPSMRTGSEAYGLEFTFSADGKVTARCHHGSD